jgi:glucosamine-phosphate N-acetyltransferase
MIKIINENIIMKEIENEDYYNGYMDLMYEFTNYKHNLSYDDFVLYLNKMNINTKIIVIYSKNEHKIIGSGTIFKINKLHNNPIGQIEDVIINNKFRGFGYGKLIINELINFGLNDFKCYKIILNCLDKNIQFYEKCNFQVAGVEMKLIK